MAARIARPDELDDCLAIRREVFVIGQGVPAAHEADGRDPDCLHLLVKVDGVLAGTARMRVVTTAERLAVAKAERVAVLERYQQRGIGRQLMEAIEAEATRRGLAGVLLHAQLSVVGFYERLGYAARGPVFVEAGIEHREMWRAS